MVEQQPKRDVEDPAPASPAASGAETTPTVADHDATGDGHCCRQAAEGSTEGCDCENHDCENHDCENHDCENHDCENCDCENHGCENHGCESCDCEESEDGVDTSWFEEHAPTVDTPTPDEIVELVVACVNFVRDALGIELDFTPETLPILDHYLLAARETLTERVELRELVWRCAGAYFGELVRRRYNGFWNIPNADVHTWRINQRQVMLSFNPVGIVAEAMAGSEHGEGPTGALRLARLDQEEIARRLADMPPLPEDQYFFLSTRLEVIDTVIEHLRVRMDQNDQANVEFDPDDYARDLEPHISA